MAHGAGGKASRRLMEGLFAPLPVGKRQRASGRLCLSSKSTDRTVAITTDSFVVKPNHSFQADRSEILR